MKQVSNDSQIYSVICYLCIVIQVDVMQPTQIPVDIGLKKLSE